jgi:hypothetical protein
LEGETAVTRAEHISWCKQRALEYVERNELSDAVASMLSDLRKHPETENHIGGTLGVGMMMIPGWIRNRGEVTKWIDGFN